MGCIVVRGHLIGARPMGQAKPGKAQLYVWTVREESGQETCEFLGSDIPGEQGEFIEVPVRAEVDTYNGQTRIKLWADRPREVTWQAPTMPLRQFAPVANGHVKDKEAVS